jgi:hypothetical protein
MSKAVATTPAPESERKPEVAYSYVGPGHFPGVPARDLTHEDVAALESGPRADLEGDKVIYKVQQADSDVRGRQNSDTLVAGLGVPPTDEPKGEAAADPGQAVGFIQSDTDPTTTVEEG